MTVRLMPLASPPAIYSSAGRLVILSCSLIAESAYLCPCLIYISPFCRCDHATRYFGDLLVARSETAPSDFGTMRVFTGIAKAALLGLRNIAKIHLLMPATRTQKRRWTGMSAS